jgi:hypothetical protein
MLYYILIIAIILILFIPNYKYCDIAEFSNKEINFKNVSNNILSYTDDMAKYLLLNK